LLYIDYKERFISGIWARYPGLILHSKGADGMEHQCCQEARIRALETEQAKTGVYYKNTRQDIEEIKEILKQLQQQKPSNAALWQPIIVEVAKLITTMALILGTLAGAEKIIAR